MPLAPPRPLAEPDVRLAVDDPHARSPADAGEPAQLRDAGKEPQLSHGPHRRRLELLERQLVPERGPQEFELDLVELGACIRGEGGEARSEGRSIPLVHPLPRSRTWPALPRSAPAWRRERGRRPGTCFRLPRERTRPGCAAFSGR